MGELSTVSQMDRPPALLRTLHALASGVGEGLAAVPPGALAASGALVSGARDRDWLTFPLSPLPTDAEVLALVPPRDPPEAESWASRLHTHSGELRSLLKACL